MVRTTTIMSPTAYYGTGYLHINFEDTNYRVVSLRGDATQAQCPIEIRFYTAQNPTVPAYRYTVQAGQDQTYTMKNNENYYLDQWSVSVLMLTPA